ncbi:Rpia, partial [Symbiodinium sp. KB8]
MAAAGAWMRLAARAVQGNRHIALAAGASAVLASSMATQASAAKSNPAAAAGKAAVPSSPLERAKRAAARGAVDEYVKSGMVVGVGSGSTIVYGIQRLAELYHLQGVDMVCVPTSFQSRQLIIEAGLPISDLTRHPELDVAIDGADEVDAALNAIKGGGACQTQEKLVAAAASKFVLVADHRKDSQVLGQSWTKGVPLEVLPGAYVTVMKRIEALGGKPHLRMAVNKAGPVITDNG